MKSRNKSPGWDRFLYNPDPNQLATHRETDLLQCSRRQLIERILHLEAQAKGVKNNEEYRQARHDQHIKEIEKENDASRAHDLKTIVAKDKMHSEDLGKLKRDKIEMEEKLRKRIVELEGAIVELALQNAARVLKV